MRSPSHRRRTADSPRLSRFVAGALLVLASLLVNACGGGRDKHAGTAADPWLIGMSQCTLEEPWRVQMNKDIADAAKAHDNIKVLFKDAQDDPAMQRSQVEELVGQGIDVLLISPKESGPLDRVVRETTKKGVPVIVLDRQVGHQDFTLFIGGKNLEIGRAAGTWVRNKLASDGGKIVILQGNMHSTPAQDRQRGFLQGLDLEKNKSLEIVFQADTDWKEAKGRAEMESALATIPKINAVFGHNDPVAHGAYRAALDAKRTNGVLFVGIDALPHEGVEYVRQGFLSATFEYPTGGKQAIASALEILGGKAPKSQYLWLPSRRFDADNVALGGEEVR